MQDHRSEVTWRLAEGPRRSVPALWLLPLSQPSPTADLTLQEQAWANALPERRREHYQWSRRWMRTLLGDLLRVPPSWLPLAAPPGQPPQLGDGWGFVSLSHCPDALLLAWAPWRIGVDVERSDRAIPAAALLRRYFCEQEQLSLKALAAEPLRRAVLDHWVMKEAAVKWQQGSLGRDLAFWCCNADRDAVVDQRNGGVLSCWRWRYGAWTLALVSQDDMGCAPDCVLPMCVY